MRASTYARAGGLPALERLEDFAFYRALLAIDARFRHSIRVRVTTSLRVTACVAGGFGSEVAAMNALAGAGLTTLVEHPRTTYEAIAARGALRRWWQHRGSADPGEPIALFGLDPKVFREQVAAAPTFGVALAAAQAFAVEHGSALRRPQVAIGDARRALAAYSAAARANASRPTLEIARSGAG
jgi:hypothetical protein